MSRPPAARQMLPPEKRNRIIGSIYAWPMGIWFTVFFLAPLLIIFAYSFMEKSLYGGVEKHFTLAAFKAMLNPQYGMIFLRTLKMSVIATAASILIALPCGYAMARSRRQTLLLILIMIPFWTNSLIRIFAWMTILGNDGVVNKVLLGLGIIKDYMPLLYNMNAVILVTIYMYLPYASLPIFTAIDRFDFSLLEAGRDLGATKLTSVLKVLIPNIKSGLVTAIIFTFIPIFGSYTVPLILGDKDSSMVIGTLIAYQANTARNWPFAAAFSLIITVISTAGVLWMMLGDKSEKK
jgi:spermidine/putrescine transport system permease protein